MTSFVSALSALVALGMLAASLWGLRRSATSSAREEALALAATRAARIRELEARLEALERAYVAQQIILVALVEALTEADTKAPITAAS